MRSSHKRSQRELINKVRSFTNSILLQFLVLLVVLISGIFESINVEGHTHLYIQVFILKLFAYLY